MEKVNLKYLILVLVGSLSIRMVICDAAIDDGDDRTNLHDVLPLAGDAVSAIDGLWFGYIPEGYVLLIFGTTEYN